MSKKFDDLEKGKKEKEEIINNLKEEFSTLQRMVKTLEKESDGQEQYSRRNCKSFHGIEENKDEITDDLVASFIKDKMDTEIYSSHRIGTSNPRKKRSMFDTTIGEMFSRTMAYYINIVSIVGYAGTWKN